MDKKNQAIELFRKGFNCAQSVLASFSEDDGISEETAFKLSCGFGGGMGRLQETCGAVTGAYMVIGMKYGKTKIHEEPLKEKTYRIVKTFTEEFKKINGSAKCIELLNCDLNTDEGKEFFKKNNLVSEVCEKCIGDAVDILRKIL